MSRFFIHRPIFAWVIAIIIMLAGVLAIRSMSIAQYPEIAPPAVTMDFVRADPLHAAIHIAWALAMLAAAARVDDARVAGLLLIFGLFYVGLAALGILVHHPFGLRLDAGENGFHSIVGPLALLIGGWALLAGRPRRPVASGARR